MIYFGLFLLVAAIPGATAYPQSGLTLRDIDIDQKEAESDNKTCVDDQLWMIKKESKVEETEGHLQDGNCPDSHFIGKLCKACKDNYSIAIGSSGCIPNSKCMGNIHLMLIIVFVAAGIVLVLLIKVLNMTVSQGAINGLVFYANVVWAYKVLYIPEKTGSGGDFLKVFLSWLNLDFGIVTCFFVDLNFYVKTWLQFVFPLYILVIAAIIILLSRCSQRMTRFFGNNAVQVLATLFLLSHAKLLRTISDATLPSRVNETQFHSEVLWAFSGEQPYLSSCKHIILFAVAISVLLLIWLPFTLTLVFIQPLRACSHYRICRLVNKLTPFFDAYTGPFNRQSHFWVGLLCLMRGILLFVYTLTYFFKNTSLCSLALIIVVLFLLLVLYGSGRLYREPTRITTCCGNSIDISFLSMLEVSFLVNLAVLGLGALSTDYIFPCSNPEIRIYIFYASVGTAFLQFIGIFVWHVWIRIKSWCLERNRNDYDNLEGRNNNVEAVTPLTRASVVVGNGTFMRNGTLIRESILTDESK